MCEPECPNQAIAMGDQIYQIDVTSCTECVGHYNAPTCQQVCPIDHTIIIDPQQVKTQEQLWDKFLVLHHADLLR
jgi:Fe-S-cluster-containing hydrogenase component 2